MKNIVFTIKNEEGLHARPATDFCETAISFASAVTVHKEGESEIFDAKSLLSILCLGAVKGDTIRISAEGDDEEQALEALRSALEKT
jgi:phosphocarrier protein